MPTKLFKNIELPKTYEESRAFYEYFNFKRRLGRMHYHTPVCMDAYDRLMGEINVSNWEFRPVILICPCSFEYTDIIDIENWNRNSTITCSNCGRCFSDKNLQIFDEITKIKKARMDMRKLQESNPFEKTYSNQYSNQYFEDVKIYNDACSKIIPNLKAERIDSIFQPAFRYRDLVEVNHKNSLTAICDLKNSDTVVSMTLLTVTLDLIQTSTKIPKYIHKLSINRETLAFNKIDKLFRTSFYQSGRFSRGSSLKDMSAGIADALPVMTSKVGSGVSGLSIKSLLATVGNLSTFIARTGRLSNGYPIGPAHTHNSNIDRIEDFIHLIEDFTQAIGVPISANELLISKRGPVYEEFLKSFKYAVLKKCFEPYQANLTLLNDAVSGDILDLSIKNFEQNFFDVPTFFYNLVKCENYTSIRAFLRQRLYLSKKGTKTFLKIINEWFDQIDNRESSHTQSAIVSLANITDPNVSYAFMCKLRETIAYIHENPYDYGSSWAGSNLRITPNSFIFEKLGRKYKQISQLFLNRVFNRIAINNTTSDNVFLAMDTLDNLDRIANRVYSIKNKSLTSDFINFLESQEVKSIHACEQAILNLDIELASNYDEYSDLIKESHLDLKQSENDYKTYERVEGQTSFSIPNHGIDMFLLGQSLGICVGGRYYQESVAKNRCQIVVATKNSKKVVLEIEKNDNTKSTESNGTVIQAKSKFNETAEAFTDMLDDIKAYIAHLKLGIRTYDLTIETKQLQNNGQPF